MRISHQWVGWVERPTCSSSIMMIITNWPSSWCCWLPWRLWYNDERLAWENLFNPLTGDQWLVNHFALPILLQRFYTTMNISNLIRFMTWWIYHLVEEDRNLPKWVHLPKPVGSGHQGTVDHLTHIIVVHILSSFSPCNLPLWRSNRGWFSEHMGRTSCWGLSRYRGLLWACQGDLQSSGKLWVPSKTKWIGWEGWLGELAE